MISFLLCGASFAHNDDCDCGIQRKLTWILEWILDGFLKGSRKPISGQVHHSHNYLANCYRKYLNSFHFEWLMSTINKRIQYKFNFEMNKNGHSSKILSHEDKNKWLIYLSLSWSSVPGRGCTIKWIELILFKHKSNYFVLFYGIFCWKEMPELLLSTLSAPCSH